MTNTAHDCLLLVASHWPPCQVQSFNACTDSKTATLDSCNSSTCSSLAAYTLTSAHDNRQADVHMLMHMSLQSLDLAMFVDPV